jgi:hypothetical protein
MSRGEAPIPTRASKARINEFAEKIGSQLGFKPGASLEPIVTRLGGGLTYHSPFSPDGAAPPSIVVENQKQFTIHLPSTTSPQRDRFTIAHELGHLFLHYPMVQATKPGARMVATRWVDDSDENQKRAEWEANWFAAGFLMPGELFRELAASASTLSKMAERLDLSEQAVSIRAQALDVTLA